jgi:hypothetical protein
MKTILSIGFNSRLQSTYFDIENPSVIPNEGEVFDCNWQDYISDEKALLALEEYSETGIWMTNIVSVYFSKEKTVVHISLMEEEHYIKL